MNRKVSMVPLFVGSYMPGFVMSYAKKFSAKLKTSF